MIVDNICLSDHLCKVYEGPHAKTGEFAKDFARLAEMRGTAIDRHLMYCLLCPRSANDLGKDYSMMIARI